MYVTGDFGTSFSTPSGRLFYVNASGGTLKEFQIGLGDDPLGIWLKGFGQDADGEIYVCGSTTLGPSGTTGVVYKLTDISGGDGAYVMGSSINIPLAQAAASGAWVGMWRASTGSYLAVESVPGSVTSISVSLSNLQYERGLALDRHMGLYGRVVEERNLHRDI